MPSLLSLLPSILPRVLLAAVLVPQTPPASRPWWMAAAVACHAAQLVLLLANDKLSGIAAVLDMVLFAGVYGSWAVVVTSVAPLIAHSDVPVETPTAAVTAVVANKNQQLHIKPQATTAVSTSSSVSTDLSSLGGDHGGSDALNLNGDDGALLQDRDRPDLESLHLGCTSASSTGTSATQHVSRSLFPDSDSVPLSPAGWIASAHHLADPESTSDVGAVVEGLRRRNVGVAADSQQHPEHTSSMLARTLQSAASSITSFALASNLLVSDTPTDTDTADPGIQGTASPPSASTGAGVGSGRLRVRTEAGSVVVDVCQLPLPASRSRLLIDDQEVLLLTPKPQSVAGQPPDEAGQALPGSQVGGESTDDTTVAKLVAADGEWQRPAQAKAASGDPGAECQGFQL